MTQRHFAAVLATFAGAVALWPPVAASAEQARSPVTIEIEVLTHDSTGTGYVITLHNNLDVAQKVVVAQHFAQSPQGTTASDGGQVSAGRILWITELPPTQPRAIESSAVFDDPGQIRSSVCVAESATGRIVDCAIGDLAPGQASAGLNRNWTRWILGLLGVAGIVLAGWFLALHRTSWWPSVPRFVRGHRDLVAVSGAMLALLGLAAAALTIVTGGAKQMIGQTSRSTQTIGWSGERSTLRFGLPSQSGNTEFTLYQWFCVEEETRRCVAAVAIRNVSADTQQWFRQMQRLYVADTWIEPDLEATTTANISADPFAGVLLPGERRLAVLVFKLAERSSPSRLELRDGAFSRGVAFNLKR